MRRPATLVQCRPTYGELVMAALTRDPAATAFVFQDGRGPDRRISYGEAAGSIARLAGALARRGVGKGTGVAVLSNNRPEAWFATVAAQLVGARTSALHALGSLADHRFICQDADIRTLVFDPAYQPHIEQLAGESSVRDALALDPTSGFDDLPAIAARAVPWDGNEDCVGEDDVASLIYTGGTTGRPKGVVRPHRCLTEMVLVQLAGWSWPARPRFLAAAPLTHATGMMLVPILMRGGTVFVHDRFDAGRWMETVERERLNSSFLVPTMLYRVLDDPAFSPERLRSLEAVFYGAAPMSPDRLAHALRTIGRVFVQFYAQAESTVVGTILHQDEHDPDSTERLTSCGRPMPGARVEIHDEDDRRVKDGEVGEVCLRGPFVMDGYWHEPAITAETLRNGWLHTGDLGRWTDDGFMTIVGRKKDMIVTGGFNVFAREVEDALSAHPDVAQAAVIGIPDAEWGEAVMAVVVPRHDHRPEPKELLDLVRLRKGRLHVPKRIEIVDAVPLTPLGKIDKKAIRSRYWEGSARQVH